jgi:hypothetical protein
VPHAAAAVLHAARLADLPELRAERPSRIDVAAM